MKKTVLFIAKLIMITIVLVIYSRFINSVNNNISNLGPNTLYSIYIMRIITFSLAGFIFSFGFGLKRDYSAILVVLVILLIISGTLYSIKYLANVDLIDNFVVILSFILGVKLTGFISKSISLD